jgi:hypothetical protein
MFSRITLIIALETKNHCLGHKTGLPTKMLSGLPNRDGFDMYLLRYRRTLNLTGSTLQRSSRPLQWRPAAARAILTSSSNSLGRIAQPFRPDSRPR